jgi:hypothetical protein
MSEENKYTETDILMRSILGEAQEEVPEHVWEGVSSELDRIEAARTRKPVVIWFRRAAIATAAAAAVAIGVFTGRNGEAGMLVPEAEGSGMVAVVEPEAAAEPMSEGAQAPELARTYVADAGKAVEMARKAVREAEEMKPAVADNENNGTRQPEEKDEPVRKVKPASEKKTETEVRKEYFPDEWPEEETEGRRKGGVSLVLSGVAGTNNAQNGGPKGPFKRPQMSMAPPKTGIEEKSTESTYGLPLSVGAGVKIDLTPRWSIGTGVNYTLLTRRFYGTYTNVDENGSVTSKGSDIRNSQQYIGIPVNAFYNIVNREHLNFYAYAGGTIEKCISDKYALMGTTITHTEKAAGVQLSANAGIGVEFVLGKHLGLYLDPSLRYYFDCGQPKSIRTVQPLMLGFEMGLRVKL